MTAPIPGPRPDHPPGRRLEHNPAMQTAVPTRTRTHLRQIRFEGFRRSDGLWDIEAVLRDERDYPSQGFERGPVAPGMPVHDIRLCVTVDDALVVQAIRGAYEARPFGACEQSLAPLQRLVGASVAQGWRRTLAAQLGGEVGCAHIRDMLVQLAAAAYQIVPVWHARAQGAPVRRADGKPPMHLGQCVAWALDGETVAAIYPEFARPAVAAGAPEPPASA